MNVTNSQQTSIDGSTNPGTPNQVPRGFISRMLVPKGELLSLWMLNKVWWCTSHSTCLRQQTQQVHRRLLLTKMQETAARVLPVKESNSLPSTSLCVMRRLKSMSAMKQKFKPVFKTLRVLQAALDVIPFCAQTAQIIQRQSINFRVRACSMPFKSPRRKTDTF